MVRIEPGKTPKQRPLTVARSLSSCGREPGTCVPVTPAYPAITLSFVLTLNSTLRRGDLSAKYVRGPLRWLAPAQLETYTTSGCNSFGSSA